jgi:predicted amidohydrolase YtcJ
MQLLRVAFIAATGAFGALAQQTAPDLILSHAKIITVDERFSIAQSLAIKGERIVAVGSNQEIARLAGPGTRTLDLRGRAVVPGLIDNHSHVLRAAGTWAKELRFDGVVSRKRAVRCCERGSRPLRRANGSTA